MQNKNQLRPYQAEGVKRLLEITSKRDAILADEPGLGKTIQIAGYINSAKPKTVLVVCPASLKVNWKRELDKWLSFFPDELDIVSYGKLNAVRDSLCPSWDLVVFDEAHYLKNPDAIRTKQSFAIPAIRRIFLTGTPIVNRPMDLWPILKAIGTKMTKMQYGKKYCNAHLEKIPLSKEKYLKVKRHARGGNVIEEGGRHYRVVWNFSGASNTAELGEQLRKTVLVRRTKAEVLNELPEKIRSVVEIIRPDNGGEPAALRNKVYSSFNVASMSFDDITRVAFEEMSALRKEHALLKVPYVIKFCLNLLEEEEKIVLFAHHRDAIAELDKAFTAAGVETVLLYGGMTPKQKQDSVDRFQTGTARVFIGQLSAAGVGLTLTAASTIVFAEIDWVLGNILQAEDRCHRMGQKHPVRIFHLTFAGTIDARLIHALVEKQNTIQEVMTNAKN